MRVSASKAALLGHCAYSFRDGVEWVETRGRAAEMGDQFHKLMVPMVETLKSELPEKCTKWLRDRMFHATVWVTQNHVKGWRAEVAYAYDPQTGAGRILGYDIGRAYEQHGKLPHEIAGSADIAWMEGETVVIADWKTGRFVTDSVWAQMEWLCVMAARATGAWGAKAIVLHATDHGIVQTEQSYDDVDLWRIAEQMRIDVNAIEDAWPACGPHCDTLYCAARSGCELYQLTNRRTA